MDLARHITLILIHYIFLTTNIYSQDNDTLNTTLPQIVITANRTATSIQDLNRHIQIIDRKLIESIKPQSIEEILNAGAQVELKSRGPFGVQTDAGIRGSLFSQNLFLINGIRINDPQTAHHNMNLPVLINEIESIEIMNGAGSAVYGADAFGGTINLLTIVPKTSALKLQIAGGENGYGNTSLTGSFATSYLRSSNSFSYKRSDGYRAGTDFKMWGLNSNNVIELPFGNYNLFAGFIKKEFGAFDFYSPGRNIPSREWVETGFVSLGTSILIQSITLEPKIYIKTNYDKFMFDTRTPDIYVNHHNTLMYGSQLTGTYRPIASLTITTGIDADADKIKSSNLGKHERTTIAGFLSSRMKISEVILIDAGIRIDRNSMYGIYANPTFGAGFNITETSKIYVNAGRSFRAPSYTDLYYTDPATKGNPDLKPESGWTYETGWRQEITERSVFNFNVFRRDQRDLIDYVQHSEGEMFHAVNFSSATIQGCEAVIGWYNYDQGSSGVKHSFGVKHLQIQYTFLESELDTKGIFKSRYSLTHPKHQAGIVITTELPLGISTNINSTFNYRSASDNYSVTNIRLMRQIGILGLFISARNIFDKHYEEIKGLPLPGRWIIGGVEAGI